MTLDAAADRVRALIDEIVGDAEPRDDTLDPALLCPAQPDPLLIQGGESLTTLALALGLFDAFTQRGGSAWSRARVAQLKSHVDARFDAGERAHVRAEIERVLRWLSESRDGIRRPDPGDDEPFSYPLEARRVLALDALASDRDLLLEFIDVDATRWHQVRCRPERLDDDDAVIVGRRVPDGDVLRLPLTRVRWLVVVARLGDLPTPRPLADVHRFPVRLRSVDPDDE